MAVKIHFEEYHASAKPRYFTQSNLEGYSTAEYTPVSSFKTNSGICKKSSICLPWFLVMLALIAVVFFEQIQLTE